MKKHLLLAAVAALSPLSTLADTGPVFDPLKVTRVYTGDTTDRIYIQFNSGAMPGCYIDAGGRLYANDPFYNQLYSQILTLMAVGGMRGAVIFESTPGMTGWSVCRIRGLDLRP